MKIALPCPGLEHIHRGYETYTRELFDALSNHYDVHLIKASGKRGKNSHVVPALRRTNHIFAFLPSKWRTEYRRFQAECWTFAVAMVPLLRREKFDVIHFSEVPLGDALRWLRPKLRLRYRLLLSNGGPWPPWDCGRFDAVHQVSPAHNDTGHKFGLKREHCFLVPYGTNSERLHPLPGRDRNQIRRQLGIPINAFVVTSLAALNRQHKRVDWLIQEFAKIGDFNGFLMLAGNREEETSELENLAERLLPVGKYKFMQLPYEDVPLLLHGSDLLVHCSLDEGFGRVLTEAMGAELPLLVHPHLTAQWIINNPACYVDMTVSGRLALRIESLARDQSLRSAIAEQNRRSFQRFRWENVITDYAQMYNHVCSLPFGSTANR